MGKHGDEAIYLKIVMATVTIVTIIKLVLPQDERNLLFN